MYRESLKLWFEGGDEKGEDKIGDYKDDYIYTTPHNFLEFYPNRRDYYFGLRYQF